MTNDEQELTPPEEQRVYDGARRLMEIGREPLLAELDRLRAVRDAARVLLSSEPGVPRVLAEDALRETLEQADAGEQGRDSQP